MPTLTGGGGRDTFISGTNNNHKQPDLGDNGPDTSYSDNQTTLRNGAGKIGHGLSRSLSRPAPEEQTGKPQPATIPQEKPTQTGDGTDDDNAPYTSVSVIADLVVNATGSPDRSQMKDEHAPTAKRGEPPQTLRGQRPTIRDEDWHSPIYIAENDIPEDATIFTIAGDGTLEVPETLTVTEDGYLELPNNILIMAPPKDGGALAPIDIDTLRAPPPASVTFSTDDILALLNEEKS